MNQIPNIEETQDIDVEKMVKKLRAPSNWLKQPRGKNWKDVSNVYDLTPFEAADALEALHHQLQKAREELAGEVRLLVAKHYKTDEFDAVGFLNDLQAELDEDVSSK